MLFLLPTPLSSLLPYSTPLWSLLAPLSDAVLMVIGCVVERAAGEDDEETLFRMLVAVAHMTVDTPDAAVLCKELGFDPAPLMASASDKVARAARELDAILAAV